MIGTGGFATKLTYTGFNAEEPMLRLVKAVLSKVTPDVHDNVPADERAPGICFSSRLDLPPLEWCSIPFFV